MYFISALVSTLWITTYSLEHSVSNFDLICHVQFFPTLECLELQECGHFSNPYQPIKAKYTLVKSVIHKIRIDCSGY